MDVVHKGYTDPNNLKFEDITVMGVTTAPTLVLVSDGTTSNALPESQVHYDSTKQVIIFLTLMRFLFTTKVKNYLF